MLDTLSITCFWQLTLKVDVEPRTGFRFGIIRIRPTIPLTGHAMALVDQAPAPEDSAGRVRPLTRAVARQMDGLQKEIEVLKAAAVAQEAQRAREVANLQQDITDAQREVALMRKERCHLQATCVPLLVPQRTPALTGYLNLATMVVSTSEFLKGVPDPLGPTPFAGFRWPEESKRKLILAFQTKAAQNVGHELLETPCRPYRGGSMICLHSAGI
jgi:hypothetical protein